MDREVYFAFAAATAAMIALPGPSVLLAVAHGLALGWRRAMRTVLGATAGIAVQLAAAVAGMSVLIGLEDRAFQGLRRAGALYLVYVAIATWRGARGALGSLSEPVRPRRLFLQGLLVTLPNPKSLIFIAAFLPQFIDEGRPLGPQYALLLPTFLAICLGLTSSWALLSGLLAPRLRQGGALSHLIKAAAALIGLSGLRMLLSP